MNIIASKKYSLFVATTNFKDFYTNFNTVFNKHQDQNIIVDLSDTSITETDIQSLDKFANIQAKNNQSFVVVVPKFNADVFEDSLNVVPTVIEAEDLIDMDEMTRDLGF